MPKLESTTDTSVKIDATVAGLLKGHLEISALTPDSPPLSSICLHEAEVCEITGLTPNKVYDIKIVVCPGSPSICSDPSPIISTKTSMGGYFYIYKLNFLNVCS